MTLKVDSKLEKNLAYGLENGIMNLANVLQQHSKVLKLGLWWDPFIQSRKYMRLKFTEELFIKTIKNNAKFDEEMTCRFEIDTTVWRTLTQTLKCLKNLHFNGLLLTKAYNAWTKKSTEELCLMALKIDVKFEGKRTCSFKDDMRNLANFHRLKNSNFIWESNGGTKSK